MIWTKCVLGQVKHFAEDQVMRMGADDVPPTGAVTATYPCL